MRGKPIYEKSQWRKGRRKWGGRRRRRRRRRRKRKRKRKRKRRSHHEITLR